MDLFSFFVYILDCILFVSFVLGLGKVLEIRFIVVFGYGLGSRETCFRILLVYVSFRVS